MTSYCTSCGAALPEGVAYCGSCGAPVAGGVRMSASVSTGQTNGKAVASLACGIGGFVVLPVALSIVALVLGYQARSELAQRPGEGGAGMATAGIVLGWVGVAVGALGLFFFMLALGSVWHMSP